MKKFKLILFGLMFFMLIGLVNAISIAEFERSWIIEKSDIEQYIDVEYTNIDKTHTEFCYYFNNKLLYSTSMALSFEKSLGLIPLKVSTEKMITDSFLDFRDVTDKNKKCITVEYKEDDYNVSVKLGWNSLVLSTASVVLDLIPDNIVRCNDNIYGVIIDGDKDIVFFNSSNNGSSWSSKEIRAGSFGEPNIITDSNCNIAIIYSNIVTTPYNNEYLWSTDLGNTFHFSNLIDYSTANMRFPDCTIDNNDKIHCCMSAGSAWGVYANFTIGEGNITAVGFNLNTNDDTDACSISTYEKDGSTCIFIGATGGDNYDLDAWLSCEDGFGDANRIKLHTGVNLMSSIDTYVTNNTLFIGASYSTTYYYEVFNRSINGGATWTQNILNTIFNKFNTPVLNYNGTNLYIMFYNSSGTYLGITNSSHNGFINITKLNSNVSSFPSTINGQYENNRYLHNKYEYITHSGGKLYYGYINLKEEEPPTPVQFYELNCTDITATQNITDRTRNLRIKDTGYIIIKGKYKFNKTYIEPNCKVYLEDGGAFI